MPIDFYYHPGGAPCRAVLLAANALGIELNKKLVDFSKGRHLTPEFIKMNPQHTLPTIDDNGFILWESRAIMTYLSDQYGKNDSLYPKDPKKRALVNQRLYFDIGTFYARCSDYYMPVLLQRVPEYEPAKLEKVKEALGFLDTFLQNEDFVAGKNLTLADLSLLAGVTTFEVANLDLSPYKNVTSWLARMIAATPNYEEVNGKGVALFKQFVDKSSKK